MTLAVPQRLSTKNNPNLIYTHLSGVNLNEAAKSRLAGVAVARSGRMTIRIADLTDEALKRNADEIDVWALPRELTDARLLVELKTVTRELVQSSAKLEKAIAEKDRLGEIGIDNLEARLRDRKDEYVPVAREVASRIAQQFPRDLDRETVAMFVAFAEKGLAPREVATEVSLGD